MVLLNPREYTMFDLSERSGRKGIYGVRGVLPLTKYYYYNGWLRD